MHNRDSFPHSPFRLMKSPNLVKTAEKAYDFGNDYAGDGSVVGAFGDDDEANFTVGQMFCINDFGSLANNQQKEGSVSQGYEDTGSSRKGYLGKSNEKILCLLLKNFLWKF